MSDDEPGIGHNSHLTEATKEKLKQMVARIERQEEEKATIAADIREIYAEAKAFGFDTKALRALIRRRRIDRAEREEMDMVLDTYEMAVDEFM